MPINPTIALGAQPQQQPVNMLGQLGQLYALKAAKQEVEGGEALREAFASGGDLNDPAFVQRLRAANPKMALEIEAKNLAGQKTRTEILKDRIAMSRDALANVNTPEAYLAWHEANHKDPMMASFFASNGITAEDSRARIMAELAKPGGLDKLKRESALGATELQKQLMQTERTYGAAAISAAPGHRQADLAVQKYRDELANPKLERVEGDTGFYLYDPRKPNSAVPLGMAPVAPAAAPVTTPAAPVNSLVTTQAAPTINLNALTGGTPSQPGAPTVANAAAADAAARAAAAQPSSIRPKQPIRQPVAVMIDGKAVLVPPEKAIGLPPASADAEKAARLRAQQVKDLDLAISNLEAVTKPKGLISQSTGSGFGRAMDVSAGFFGQATEGAIAGAKLAPIADLVLKMVPRFEGPQSDKDTQSYKEASAQLANTSLPTEIRRQAGIEVLRIMKARKDQFVSSAMNNEGLTSGSSAGGADPLGIRQ